MKPLQWLALAGLTALTCNPLLAQTSARTPEEQKTLDRATEFYTNIIGKLKVEQFKDYVAPTFIEHHPGVDGNLDSLVAYFTAVRQKNPNGMPPEKVLVSLVDRDLVALVVVRGKHIDKKDPSKSYLKLGVEVMRFKDGKQVEHWDEEANLTDDAKVASLLGSAQSTLR
jgi:predicted SnoaL-like aldol condensation-catalyzing enzyme